MWAHVLTIAINIGHDQGWAVDAVVGVVARWSWPLRLITTTTMRVFTDKAEIFDHSSASTCTDPTGTNQAMYCMLAGGRLFLARERSRAVPKNM